MEQVMYDVYVAEATMESDYRTFDSPEKKEAYINQVFIMNGVSQVQWDTSLSWYSDRIDLYLKMNDSVKARLKRIQSGIDSEMAQLSIEKIDIDESVYSASYIPKYFSFSLPEIDKNRLRFSIDSTEISEKITDTVFSFNYSVNGVNASSIYNLTSLISLVYSDTTIYHSQKITENKIYSSPIEKYIVDDTLKQIYGYIKLENPTGINLDIELYNISMGDK